MMRRNGLLCLCRERIRVMIMLLKWRKRFMLSSKLISARKEGRGKHVAVGKAFSFYFEICFYFDSAGAFC